LRKRLRFAYSIRIDQPTATITEQGTTIRSSKTINVLGELFDSKLLWGPQVAHAIVIASRALYAIKINKKYFSVEQIKTLLTSLFHTLTQFRYLALSLFM
jgi:hypothetical protein